MKKFLQWTFWIASVLFILFFGTIAIGTRYAKKVAPWPDPVPGVSLTPARPFLAASNIGPDNAYFYFLQLTNHEVALSWRSEDAHKIEWSDFRTNGVRWSKTAYTNLDAWISTNRGLLDLLVRSSELTNSQAPTMDRFESVMPELSLVMTLQRVQYYETSKACAEGRIDDAVSNIEVTLRSTVNFEPGQAMIGRALATAFDQLALEQIKQVAFGEMISRENSLKLSGLIEWRITHREPLPEAMKYEALQAQNCVDMVYEKGVSTGLGVSSWAGPGFSGWLAAAEVFLPLLSSTPERTREHLASFYSHLVNSCGNLEESRKAELRLDALCDHSQARYFDDPVGRIMAALLLPSVNKFTINYIKTEAKFDAANVILATERWRMDHGDKPPAAVGDLVPKYLGKIPEDPFAKGSNLLFRADAESYVVYSVGMDGDDDGGDVEGASPGDVGWRVKLERRAKE